MRTTWLWGPGPGDDQPTHDETATRRTPSGPARRHRGGHRRTTTCTTTSQERITDHV